MANIRDVPSVEITGMQTRDALKLGSRGSPLAVAQSRQIAAELTHLIPDLEIEIVTHKTRGDRKLDVPLTEVRDDDFFVAELDQALLSGEVDFCVHSLKDLGHQRPDELSIAAIPQRENPRDVVIFRNDIVERLKRGAALKIGTSSLRRTVNVQDFLPRALPWFGASPRIEFRDLRGPVDQRLRRISPEADDRGRLDGVVLALAGLNRLWNDVEGRNAMRLTEYQPRWMILPLTECPTAPGQGALAIECRTDDQRCHRVLHRLHDAETASLVRMERNYLHALPETQRASVGVTAVRSEGCGPLMSVRGRQNTATSPAASLQQMIWRAPPRPKNAIAWDGGAWAGLTMADTLQVALQPEFLRTVFVAHWRAVTENLLLPEATRAWTSGPESWYRLAKQGIWIEGCADNLGFAELLPTLGVGVLQLPPLRKWSVLTHADATAGWDVSGVGKVIATYRIRSAESFGISAAVGDKLSASTHFYWRSPQQFRTLQPWLPSGAHHACGPGKTLQALRRAGLDRVQAFPSREEWQQWLG